MRRGLGAVAAGALALALAGCDESAQQAEKTAATAEAQRFLAALSGSKPSNEAAWGLRNLRVFGPRSAAPEVEGAAGAYRVTYSLWCKGTSSGGTEVKRSRKLLLQLAKSGKDAWAVKKSEFREDHPLSGWRQIGWCLLFGLALPLMLWVTCLCWHLAGRWIPAWAGPFVFCAPLWFGAAGVFVFLGFLVACAGRFQLLAGAGAYTLLMAWTGWLLWASASGVALSAAAALAVSLAALALRAAAMSES